jgi:thiol-disulfide isomerase/thioredoxin
MNKYFRFLVILLLVATSSGSGAGQGISDAVTQALARGDAFLKEKEFAKAREAYGKADALSHHQCAECYLSMFRADREEGDLSSALDDAKRAVKAAGDNKSLASKSLTLRAALLAQMAGKPGDKKLKEAEEGTRQAIALDPSQMIAHYNLGQILIREERDSEGITELKTYIAAPGADPKLVREARGYIVNPIRAREPFAPDFSFTTLDGQTLSNTALLGKVVLFDFWGSWCEPCRESIPILLALREKYLQRPVQLVGVSSDQDEQAWKQFISSHHMDWPEYIDLSGKVLDQFDVESYPTFVVVDRDGIIRLRETGIAESTAAELDEAITKALKRPAQPGLVGPRSAPTPEEHVAADTATPPAIMAPSPANAPPGKSADVDAGVISGSVYRNDLLGLSYQFPSDWTATPPTALHNLNERRESSVRARMMQDHPELGSAFQIMVPKTILYASERGEGDGERVTAPSVRIIAVPWNTPRLTLDSVKTNTERMNPPETTLVRETEQFRIGDHDCFRTEFELSGNYQHARLSRSQTIASGYLIVLEIYAQNSEQLAGLDSTVKTFSFSSR